MYSTCPKCGHEHSADQAGSKSCPACGLVYAKWIKNLASDPQLTVPEIGSDVGPSLAGRLGRFFLQGKPGTNRFELAGYGLIWIVLAIWGWQFIAMDYRSAEIMNSFLHNVDLIFHEAGHVIFSPFGRYMMYLGGSLFQVLLPLILMGAFLVVNRDAFAASVCLWWAGQSLMDLAPYIADARVLRLPLLGGGTGADSPGRHDWANLLRPIGMLQQDTRIAETVDTIGSGLILLALVWGAYMLRVYYKSVME
ncbi:MAG: zinc ribbon domain-containing protein [Gammaproteobacteria bacterium]